MPCAGVTRKYKVKFLVKVINRVYNDVNLDFAIRHSNTKTIGPFKQDKISRDLQDTTYIKC